MYTLNETSKEIDMQIIQAQTKPIMLLSGGLTCTMAYAIFFPEAALTSQFGESLDNGALAQIVVRSWAALITLVGAMLLYGAFRPAQRVLILTFAGLSKLVYVILLLVYGSAYMPTILMPIIVDGTVIILFAFCLAGEGRKNNLS
jgi:hypothetical protein